MPPVKKPPVNPPEPTVESWQAQRDARGLRWPNTAAKLAYIQTHVTNVQKSGFNEHHKFAFIEEHGMFEVLRPLLRETACAVVVSPAQYSVTKEGTRTMLHGSVSLLCADTGDSITASYAGEGVDTQDKGTAKAQTHFSKYALQKFFLIPTQAIDDSDEDRQADQRASQPPAAVSGAAPGMNPNGTQKPDTMPEQSVVDETLEIIKHYVAKEKVLDANKVKAKIASFRVGKLNDLNAAQLTEFTSWANSEVEKARAKAEAAK